MTEKGSWCAFASIFRISKCFHGSKLDLYIYISSQKGSLKILKPTAYVQKVQIWSIRPFKNYSSYDLIPLNAGCVSLIRLSLLALLLLFIVGRRWMNVLNMEINISSLASKHSSVSHHWSTFTLHFWNYPAKIELPLSQPPPCSKKLYSIDCSRALTQHLCVAEALSSFSQNTCLQYHPENTV
jgi:hypothetical protein